MFTPGYCFFSLESRWSTKFCLLFCISCCYGWLMIYVCTWCSCWYVLISFHSGLLIIFFRHVIYSRVLLLFTWWPTLTYTHPPTLQGFCADAHRFTLKYWWVVDGVCWTTFGDSPYLRRKWLHFGHPGKSNMVCCLSILFITRSGSCTRRPPRHLLCWSLSHRR